MAKDVVVTIPFNTLMDRMRVLQSDLAQENRHTDALILDFALQILTSGSFVPNERQS